MRRRMDEHRSSQSPSSKMRLSVCPAHTESRDVTCPYRRPCHGGLRFISAAMVHHARQKNAFGGVEADLFFNGLIDALAGLLSAPESDETKSVARAMEQS